MECRLCPAAPRASAAPGGWNRPTRPSPQQHQKSSLLNKNSLRVDRMMAHAASDAHQGSTITPNSGSSNSSSSSNTAVSAIEASRSSGPQPVQLDGRRGFMLGAVVGLLAAAMAGQGSAWAEEEPRKLPKAYRSVAEKIIKSLREALDLEGEGAKENEVRRKADPAKENVREFMAKWRGDARVSWHPSHDEFVAAITELSQFYKKAGPRAGMTREVKISVESHLDAAEKALAVVEAAPARADGQVVDSADEAKIRALLSGA